MAEMGYEDGKVFRFHHKHDGEIYVNDVFVVMDGKLTAVIGGFSMMLVTNVGSNNAVSNAETYNSGQTVNLYVGDEKIYYCNLNGNNNGTWKVTDTSGAIHYTVHSNSNNSAAIGNGQLRACWISIVALKETTTPVTLVYDVGNNQQTYYLNITAPKADKGKKRLYIKDDVNYSGRIVAALVDENGNEIPNGLEGASFSWSRDDGLFIVPVAYDVDYKGVNIARDHGGLTESKKDTASNKYKPVTYTVKVVLADGSEFEDSYTVYYQSEIINSGFEFPDSKTRDYSFFPNGYPELYWKTTAPGTGSSNITKDVEYGDVTGNNGAAEYTVLHAADYKSGGVQFAELNAEAFGALYQDIITVPHEDIVWDFSHAARYPSWGQGTTNKMYIVIGATEDAQKLKSQTELEELGQAAKNKGVVASGGPVEVTYKGANYYVWYHDADNDKGENDGGWFPMSGTYTVPDNQYRTRVFFVSDKGTSTHPNSGNLIDISRAGQYKTFLIEYYEETYENGELKVKYWGSKTEKGEALVYSSQPLKNFDFFEKVQYDYLHKIIINGNNYPYDIRYAEGSDISAALYIEKYPVNTEQNKKPNISEYEQDDNGNDILNNNNYADYEIVMQVYFRDTVIAVQKELVFPSYVAATSDTPEVPGMTEEQKLTLMNKLKDKNGGYNVDFVLTSDDKTKPGGVSFVPEEGTVTITNRDPAGKYKGYLALGENPPLDNNYFVEELKPTDPEGLILDKVVFSIYRYAMGKSVEDEPVLVSYNEIDLNASKQLITGGIYFGDVKVDGQELSVKIADVTVTNYYREKMTTIKYKAVGNGKVSLTGESDYQDVPTEELAYYSGKSKGVKVHAGNDATFVGWFKDEACTIPVENKDGVVGADGTFKPNANIIAADEITFYAKFATTTISIERTNAEPNQVFVYKVTNADNSTTMYVTLTCDKNGNGKREIFEVAAGEYTVTELSDLTWRYPQTSQTAGDISSTLITFEFDASFNNDKWLNGYSDPLKNVYTP